MILSAGLTVDNISLFVRFERKTPFKKFADDCCNGRRQADTETGDEMAGTTYKLQACSLYGKRFENVLENGCWCLIQKWVLVSKLLFKAGAGVLILMIEKAGAGV